MKLRGSEFEVACRKAGGEHFEEEQTHKDEHGMVYQHTHDLICDLGDRGELALIEEPAPADTTLSGEVDGQHVEAFGVDHEFRDVHLNDDGRLVFEEEDIVV